MLKLVCDRCGKERPAKITAYANTHTQAMAGSAHAEIVMENWAELRGKHLCSDCDLEVSAFILTKVQR